MLLREHSRIISKMARWGDFALQCVAFVIAYAVTQGLPQWTWLGVIQVLLQQAGLLLLAGLAFRAAAYWEQLYRSHRMEPITTELFPLLRITAISFVPFTLGAYVLQPGLLTPEFVLLFGGGTIGLIFTQRLILRFGLRRARVYGRNFRRVLLVGTNERTLSLAVTFVNHPEYGIRLLGLVDDRELPAGPWPEDIQIVADIDSVHSYMKDHVVDDVFISLPMKSYFDRIQTVIASCEEIGIRAHVITDFYHPEIASHELGLIGRLPYVTYTTEPRSVPKLMVKRTIDIVCSAAALIVLSPVLALCALAVRLSSPGPVFFGQKRAGFHNRPFIMWKFRTMVQDADALKKTLLDQNEAGTAAAFKMRRDPRITPLGRFLRKYSLDELPQLWNVLVGDMSLVGPRPLIYDEAQAVSRPQQRRVSMKPGLTCIWQVSGRNFIGFEQWVEMDLEYIDNWSLTLDARLMLRTIPVVLTGHGAF